jgi:hypothetical protein
MSDLLKFKKICKKIKNKFEIEYFMYKMVKHCKTFNIVKIDKKNECMIIIFTIETIKMKLIMVINNNKIIIIGNYISESFGTINNKYFTRYIGLPVYGRITKSNKNFILCIKKQQIKILPKGTEQTRFVIKVAMEIKPNKMGIIEIK